MSEYPRCAAAGAGRGLEILSADNKGLREMSLVLPSQANLDAWLRSAGRQPCAYGCCRASRILALAKRVGVSPEVPEVYRQLHQEKACLCRRVRSAPSFVRWRRQMLLFRGRIVHSQ